MEKAKRPKNWDGQYYLPKVFTANISLIVHDVVLRFQGLKETKVEYPYEECGTYPGYKTFKKKGVVSIFVIHFQM